MSRPTDRVEQADPEDDPEEIPKIPLVHTGFRELDSEHLEKSRSKGSHRTRNPLDRKNLIYVVFAIFIVIVISVLLELKQIRDASLEPEHPTPTASPVK
jgi:hypothetical protein